MFLAVMFFVGAELREGFSSLYAFQWLFSRGGIWRPAETDDIGLLALASYVVNALLLTWHLRHPLSARTAAIAALFAWGMQFLLISSGFFLARVTGNGGYPVSFLMIGLLSAPVAWWSVLAMYVVRRALNYVRTESWWQGILMGLIPYAASLAWLGLIYSSPGVAILLLLGLPLPPLLLLAPLWVGSENRTRTHDLPSVQGAVKGIEN